MRRISIGIAAVAMSTFAAAAQESPAPAPSTQAAQDHWPEAWFEVFRIAPGRHEEFIRRIARSDEVARAGGQPPTQMFIHQIGADWDVLLYKPVRTTQPTPEQEAAMAARRRELGVETGPDHFATIRELIASHTDSKAYGPITAAQFLERLERLRRERRSRRADRTNRQ
jgi:hypothetical protein